jgi:predicted acetyltransferase
MTEPSDRSGAPPQIDLVRATPADQQRLANLLELYVHDFSEILGMTPDNDGRFGYPLAPYWSDAGRFPFLIRSDGQLAGFALVASGSQVTGDPNVFDVAEFFVVRGVRRHGVGLAAALRVFASFAGTWEVRVLEQNSGALGFWERAVSVFTKGRFESFAWRSERGKSFRVYRFASPGSVPGEL